MSSDAANLPRIRLRYSSLVLYAARIYRMLVAVGFVVVVARKLSVQEFGLWGIILSTTLMLTAPASLLTFWEGRYVGRGFKEAFGTSLLLGSGYVALGSLIYVALSYGESLIIGWGFNYMLEGLSILVLSVYNSIVNSALSVTKPEGVGYGRFVYETVRLLTAYLAVAILKQGVGGAILSVALALLINLAFNSYLLGKLKVVSLKWSRTLAIKWLRSIYVPALNVANGFLFNGLRAFIAWVTGSDVSVAYLNVGMSSISTVTTAATSVTPGLYAKALRRVEGADVVEVLRIYAFITGFMGTVFIGLAKPITSLYNPVYLPAYTVLALMTLYGMISGLASLYSSLLTGIEKVELEEAAGFKELMKSYLVKAPLTYLGFFAFLYAVIPPALMLTGPSDPLKAALTVSILMATCVTVPAVILVKEGFKAVHHSFPLREFTAAVISGVTTGIYFFVSGASFIQVRSFLKDAAPLGIAVVAGGAIYLGVWWILSPWFRLQVRSALKIVRR